MLGKKQWKLPNVFLGNAMHNIIGDNQRLSPSTVAFLRKTSVHVSSGVVEIRA